MNLCKKKTSPFELYSLYTLIGKNRIIFNTYNHYYPDKTIPRYLPQKPRTPIPLSWKPRTPRPLTYKSHATRKLYTGNGLLQCNTYIVD